MKQSNIGQGEAAATNNHGLLGTTPQLASFPCLFSGGERRRSQTLP